MLENTIERFTESLFLFLTGQTTSTKGLLIKKHAENLKTHGEFSFPNSPKLWKDFFQLCTPGTDDTLLEFIGKTYEDVLEESKKWKIQVKKIKEEKGRVYLFIERLGAIPYGLSEGIRNIALISQRLKESRQGIVQIDPHCEGSDCLTILRIKYLSKVLNNLCAIRFSTEEQLPQIFVTSKSSSSFGASITCGAVLNAITGKKEINITADDFIRSRQDIMTRIARHKYGVRVQTDHKWRKFISHLGESAAAFELLEVRPTSVVKVNVDNLSAGSSKGAAFILYNCARLETILRTYEEFVTKGSYPPLPDFEDIDFSLLVIEDEWILIFSYIMVFPSMLESCICFKDNKYTFRPHHICRYLSAMVKLISKYYRTTRVLAEPRSHLMPIIQARIHLLKVLSDILKTCLRILNIRSVSQM